MSWTPELIATLAGGALLVVALALALRARVRRRREVRRMLELALRDPDVGTRRAAVFVAVDHGVAPVADLLVAATHGEQDPRVLDAIAEAVARNQWEPTENRAMLELRLWARRRHDDARSGDRETEAHDRV